MSKLQVLVTTMHQIDFSLIEKMNLKSDVIFANQTDSSFYNEKVIDKNVYKLVSTNTIGKSVNQNIGILYSDADIIVFSDDDLVFVDNYEKIILDFFERHPDADAVKFFCESDNPERPLSFKCPQGEYKVGKFNIMSAGTPGLAIKSCVLKKNNIFFDQNFGPGTPMRSGEDSIFYNELIKNKVSIYVSDILLARIKQSESSWYNGIDEQIFITAGKVYRKIYGIIYFPFVVRRALIMRKRKNNPFSFFKMILLMCCSQKSYLTER